MIRIARPGPGNGWRQTIRSGRPSSSPTRRTSSLNSSAQRLDELHPHVLRQPADVVVRLDQLGVVGAAGLDHVGVERPLHEEAHVAEAPRLLLEDADELLADDHALLLGIGRRPRAARGTAPAPARARAARGSARRTSRRPASASSWRSSPWSTKTHVSWSPTALWTSSAATAESTPPRESAEHALAADLRADPLDLLLDHGRGRPRRRRVGDVVEEVLQQLHAVRRVHDLGMELDAVQARARAPRTRRSASTASRRRRARRSAARRPSRGGDIHTVCSPGRSWNSSTRSARSSVLPNSETPVRSTRPPRSSASSCMP